MKYLGIDLAAKETNPTGIALISSKNTLKPKLQLVLTLKTNKEILGFIKKTKPDFIAIDAPLLPKHKKINGYRDCEKKLISLGLRVIPPNFLKDLTQRARKLVSRISAKVIEVHPRSSSLLLEIEAKKTSEIQSKLSLFITEISQRKLSKDEVDALLAAYTAYLFDRKKTKTLGNTDGQIVLPLPRRFKLAVFDMDGTITKPISSWEHIHRYLGTWHPNGKENLKKFLNKEIDYATFAVLDTIAWKGTSLNELKKITGKIEYIEGAKTLVKNLQKKGIEIAIISGGLSVIADNVAKDLKVKHVFANDLLNDGKILNGKIKVNVHYNGKLKIYKKLLKQLNIKPYEVLSFGDSGGDISLFENSAFSIAIKPLGKKVAEAADISVNSFKEFFTSKTNLDFF